MARKAATQAAEGDDKSATTTASTPAEKAQESGGREVPSIWPGIQRVDF